MRWVPWVAALLGLALVPASAQAPQRVALVIANANYSGYAPLPNTTVDSGLVADALRRAGFATVEVKTNLGIAGFRTALGAFQSRAAGAEVAVIYYAGHGIEVGGRNWLIPADAQLENDAQLAFQAIDADLVVQAAAGARARLVVLDACRENPFAGRMRRTGRLTTRDAAPGLAPPVGEGVRGTLLMYSAAPGELAADGAAGSGSPFARAFARYLPEPGVELRVAAGKIADAVYAETNAAQLPFTSSSLSGAEIYLVAGARATAPDPEVERLRRELEALRNPAPSSTSAPPIVASPQSTSTFIGLWRVVSVQGEHWFPCQLNLELLYSPPQLMIRQWSSGRRESFGFDPFNATQITPGSISAHARLKPDLVLSLRNQQLEIAVSTTKTCIYARP